MLPCVWMSAGLVSFKLCDREGECEGCPFDRVMRGLAPLPPLPPGSGGEEPPAPAPRRRHGGDSQRRSLRQTGSRRPLVA